MLPIYLSLLMFLSGLTFSNHAPIQKQDLSINDFLAFDWFYGTQISQVNNIIGKYFNTINNGLAHNKTIIQIEERMNKANASDRGVKYTQERMNSNFIKKICKKKNRY